MEPTQFINTVLDEGKNGLRCFLCFRQYEYLYSINSNDIDITEENGLYKICIFDALSELFIDNIPAPVFEQICKACSKIFLQFYTLISKYKIYMRIFSSFSENVYNEVGKEFEVNNEHKIVKCIIKINLIENTLETDGEIIQVIEDKLYKTHNENTEEENKDDDESEVQNDSRMESEIQSNNNDIEIVFQGNNFENEVQNNIDILGNNIENENKVQANDNVVKVNSEINGLVQDCSSTQHDFNSQVKNIHSKELKVTTVFDCELNNINKPFSCDECEMNFMEQQELIMHKDKIHYKEPKSLLCHICGKKLKSINRLKKHSLRHEQKKCPHCPKMLLPNSYFKLHVQSHTSGIFMCNDCDYKSTNKGSLEAHINRVHNRQRPHVCEVCKKGFYKKSHLVEHKIVHKSKLSRRLICSVCHMNFSKKKCLDDHMRNHTGDKPYKCNFCEEKFVTASRRSSHMKRKHLEKAHQCPFCKKKFCLNTDVNRHVKNVHAKKKRKKGE